LLNREKNSKNWFFLNIQFWPWTTDYSVSRAAAAAASAGELSEKTLSVEKHLILWLF
jgi:hypothetical protein